MANAKFVLGSPSTKQGPTASALACYYIADTDAGKPVTGLNAGDLCFALDTAFFYTAINSTSWSRNMRYSSEQLLVHLPAIFTDYSSSQGLPPVLGDGADPPNISTGHNVSRVNRITQGAGIASVKLTDGVVQGAAGVGVYRVSYFLRCTTADVTAGTISFSTTYTDNVGATTETSATVALTSTVNRTQGAFVIYLASGDITWLTTLTGIAGTSKYQIRVRCEYLQ